MNLGKTQSVLRNLLETALSLCDSMGPMIPPPFDYPPEVSRVRVVRKRKPRADKGKKRGPRARRVEREKFLRNQETQALDRWLGAGRHKNGGRNRHHNGTRKRCVSKSRKRARRAAKRRGK